MLFFLPFLTEKCFSCYRNSNFQTTAKLIIAIGEGFDFNKVCIVCEGMMLCTILHQSIVESIISLLSSFFIVNMVMAYKGDSDLGECQHTFRWNFQFVIVKCIEKSLTYLTEQIFAFFVILRFTIWGLRLLKQNAFKMLKGS